MLLAMSSVSCGQDRPPAEKEPKASNVTAREGATKMKITIGSKVFNASLFDSPTAEAFKAMLPLTVEMGEFNGNEKDHKFSKSFPTDDSNPKTINSGDLMIWGSNTLVLFYKTFPTSYRYTRLGRIDDPSVLESAVGKGNVTVTFELETQQKSEINNE